MCGITGIFNFDLAKPVNPNSLKKMTDIISHRGPDGEGYFISKNIGLGHRRLSIIDLATGDQPMFNEDKSIALIFNGEIYNYIELRVELIKLGHLFRTTSDTEVIIKAYEQWGIGCQSKFNGMWAFALWNEKKKQLFLSRDRIGEKPLYYSILNNSLIFSSEIKSLFAYGVRREIRQELIEIYLVLTNIPGPDSFFKNIYKLNPGHSIIANSEGITENKYWDLPEIDELNMLRNKQAIYEEFNYLFEDSIKIRMRSEVPYGAFLSGGLDSSSIVALMSKISAHPIETFTIGFPQKDFDESNLAKLVSNKFNTNHHLDTITDSTLIETINYLSFHFDEPFGDSSAIPTYHVSKYASKQVKMVLTGDGGDEVLSGYNSYAGIKFQNYYSKIPIGIQNTILNGVDLLSNTIKGNTRYELNRLSNILKSVNYPFEKRIAFKSAFTPLFLIKNLTLNIKGKINIEDFLIDMVKKVPYKDDFYKLMYVHFKHNLPDDYLVKVDRMSMANSIETRAPFLDHRLIEFMVQVDKNVKMQGFEHKSILKNTIGKQLPVKLLSAPKKGFRAPLSHWFNSDSSITNLNNIKTICDSKTLTRIIDDNRNRTRDNGNFLWTLAMLDKLL